MELSWHTAGVEYRAINCLYRNNIETHNTHSIVCHVNTHSSSHTPREYLGNWHQSVLSCSPLPVTTNVFLLGSLGHHLKLSTPPLPIGARVHASFCVFYICSWQQQFTNPSGRLYHRQSAVTERFHHPPCSISQRANWIQAVFTAGHKRTAHSQDCLTQGSDGLHMFKCSCVCVCVCVCVEHFQAQHYTSKRVPMAGGSVFVMLFMFFE